MSIELGIVVALAMLLGNAYFVGAEFGLVSARRSNIELKALTGSKPAKITLVAMEQVSLMLAGAQLGVTLCSLILGAVAEPLIVHQLEGPLQAIGITGVWVHTVSFVLALAFVVYLHVVIGEMVPKNLALAGPTKAALLLVPPLFVIVNSIRPLIVALNAVANGTLRLVGIKPRQEIASSFGRDEVAGFVKESHREGFISEEEEQLLSGTLEFEGQTVKSIILPLEKLTCTSARPTAQEAEDIVAKTGFSRLPVRGRGGILKGYIHLKDLLAVSDDEVNNPLATKYIRLLPTIKYSTTLRGALAAMQQSGAHICQVTDRHATVLGVVMLEDVLEELVGAIRDETQKVQ